MKKLNYFSPLPPLKSGISDYSEELLKQLSKYFEITAYIDNNYIPKKQKNVKLRNYKNFHNKKPIIYNIGNSEYHTYIYSQLIRNPGIVILHDKSLNNLNLSMLNRYWKAYTLNKEIFLNHGIGGLRYYFKMKNSQNKEKMIFEKGWHDVENIEGEEFRWTKKRAFFSINEKAKEIHLEVYTEYPARLKIIINNKVNKIKLLSNKRKKIIISLKNPSKIKAILKISKPKGIISQIKDSNFRSMGIRIYSLKYKNKNNKIKNVSLSNKIKKCGPYKKFSFHLNKKIIKSAKAIITHSQDLEKYVKKINPKIPVTTIYHGVYDLKPKITKKNMRKKLGLDNYDFIACSFGKIQNHKRIKQALISFKEFSKENKNSVYILMGEEDGETDIKEFIKEHKISNILITGYIKFERAIEYIYSSDVSINLRGPTTGAMSGSLIKTLAIGTPCIITDLPENNQFSESYIFKIRPDKKEIKNISSILSYLKNNPKKQEEISKKTLENINKNYLWKNQTLKIKNFIEKVYKNENSNS